MLGKMRGVLIFCLLFLANCNYKTRQIAFVKKTNREKIVLVSILPMEDKMSTSISSEALRLLSTTLLNTMTEKMKKQAHIALTDNKKSHFLVTSELIQYDEDLQNLREVTISIHLKIEDIRSDPYHVILQEVITLNTYLDKPLHKELFT